ncbi:MAG TPA: ClpX C4-type zinc finger protein [Candidatus Dormibacteraeota bacterium]|nr:ClpX C4-type zinc finger protein [Candidatus Dormibacteraeota bacterium]
MPIDDALLRRATAARDHAEELQREAARSRLEFHEAVCDLHRAGASLREIAEALDLSHQRVHQIVESPGGRGVWARLMRRGARAPRPRRPPSCSFCSVHQFDTRKLIAGPGVWICDGCVVRARHVVDAGAAQEGERARLKPAEANARCNFCGKGARRTGRKLVTGAGVAICTSCLDLCDEIAAEDREQRS